MIPNQWYVVLSSLEVRKQPVGVTRMGEKLVFWRDGSGQVACCRDRCAHRGVQLSRGKRLDSGRLQCPFHGFEYDASGRVQRIPANGKDAPVAERFRVHSYPVHEAHGFIWIWWGPDPTPDPDTPRFFDDLADGFTWAQIIDPWKAHYTRVIENQLDPVHLPFVHADSIGRGNRTLVDGPVVQWLDEDRLVFYTYNRVDDGTPPRRPEEIRVDPDRDYHLGFIYPNLWENYIGKDVRVMAAFVPVDDEHTLLYLRFYQRFLRIPVLGALLARLAMPFNRRVAHQDRRVVETHQPQRVSLKMGENLIQGDRPLVVYRKRRAELLAAAGQGQADGG